MNHADFMHRCLELAEKGRGRTGINPLVGAVLVRGDAILAEGYYRGPGTDHAERDMFKNFDQTLQQGDTVYVNLEPCCHHGNTLPCTDLLLEKEVSHVVYGMRDPDPRVAGQGIERLRDAGITVTGPVLRAQCERLNRGYISLRTQGRPYITLKRAQTRDGRIANEDGSKLCITSQEQNIWSHTHLRTTHDAILVGVGTVIADDPELTIRLNKKIDQNFPQPIKVIFDPHLEIPLDANVVGERTVIIKDAQDAEDAQDAKEKQLREKGVAILAVPRINAHFDWDLLWKEFSILHSPFSISSILVEGGPKVWESFKKSGFFDEEVILVG